jgi:hypothetical protein
VAIWYPAHAWRANNVPVDVVYDGGLAPHSVNQQLTGSQWRTLGTYRFGVGTGGRVVVKTLGTSGGQNGNSFVAVDAVRFRPVALDVPVIVDSNQANNIANGSTVTISSGWSIGTATINHGGDYVHDGNANKSTSTTVTFRPNIPATGNYQVQVWHVANPNRATNVPVEINHAGGPTTEIVDQEINGSQWVPLDTYAFNAGTGGSVVFRTKHENGTNTNGYVVADAVRFVRR